MREKERLHTFTSRLEYTKKLISHLLKIWFNDLINKFGLLSKQVYNWLFKVNIYIFLISISCKKGAKQRYPQGLLLLTATHKWSILQLLLLLLLNLLHRQLLSFHEVDLQVCMHSVIHTTIFFSLQSWKQRKIGAFKISRRQTAEKQAKHLNSLRKRRKHKKQSIAFSFKITTHT